MTNLFIEIGNEQAARSVLADAEKTEIRLSRLAGSLKLCDNPRLSAMGYRVIHFAQHKYFMIYRIDGDNAYVEGVYHELQDYEDYIN